MLDGKEIEVVSAAEFPDVREPEETGATFEENARLKALYYARMTGLPALADDSGLVVDALGGRPGVHSARYANDDGERNAKLLGELGDTPNRSARFFCVAAFAADGKIVAQALGTLEGRIARQARGENGFGFDPVFQLQPPDNRHLAELGRAEKNEISHRAKALQQIMPEVLKFKAKRQNTG